MNITITKKPGVVAHILILALRRHKDLCEFKSNLFYIVSFRAAKNHRETQFHIYTEKTKKEKKKQKKSVLEHFRISTPEDNVKYFACTVKSPKYKVLICNILPRNSLHLGGLNICLCGLFLEWMK